MAYKNTPYNKHKNAIFVSKTHFATASRPAGGQNAVFTGKDQFALWTEAGVSHLAQCGGRTVDKKSAGRSD